MNESEIEEMRRLRREADQSEFLADKLSMERDEALEHLRDLCLEAGMSTKQVDRSPYEPPNIMELTDMLVEHYERRLTEKDNQYIEALHNRALKAEEPGTWAEVEKLKAVVLDDGCVQLQTLGGLVVRRFCPDPDSWHEFEYGDRVWDGHWLQEDGQVTFEVFETFVNSSGERHSDVGKSVLLEVL
jgi:hypothetical protein